MQPRVLAINFVHGLSEPRRATSSSGCAPSCASPRAGRATATRGAGVPGLRARRDRRPDRAARRPSTATPRGSRAPPTASASTTARCTSMRLHDGLHARRADRARAGQRGLAARRSHRPQRAVGDRRGQAHLRRGFRPLRLRAARRELRRAQRAVDRPQPAHPVRQLRARRRLRDGEPRPLAGADGDVRRAALLRALLPRVRDARPRPPLRAAVRVAVPEGPHVAYPSPTRCVPRGLAPAPRRGLRAGRRQRALHAQRALRLRPRRRRPGPLDDRDLAPAGRSRRARGRPPSSSPTASWRPTAWAAGSSTGARTCRASTTPRSTTTAAR